MIGVDHEARIADAYASGDPVNLGALAREFDRRAEQALEGYEHYLRRDNEQASKFAMDANWYLELKNEAQALRGELR